MKRQTALFFYVLGAYVVLQFAWWGYHLIELTKTLVPQGIWGVRVHSVKPHVDVIAGAK